MRAAKKKLTLIISEFNDGRGAISKEKDLKYDRKRLITEKKRRGKKLN